MNNEGFTGVTKSDMLIALHLKHCIISEQSIAAEGDCISAGLCELAHRYLHTRAATVGTGSFGKSLQK